MTADYVFDPAPQPTLPVAGDQRRFPVRRIYCVGRNYAEHAREMGHDPDREPPFFFSKPAGAIVPGGVTVPYPPQTEDLHYEGELVVALKSGGRDLTPEQAMEAVFGFAVGNDLTRRDMQAEAKSLRRPWDLSKGFDGSAVIGELQRIEVAGDCSTGRIASYVNGALRQEADLSHMIWSVPEVICALSASVTLAAGDLIMTGTPAGVGCLKRGDRVMVEIDGLGRIQTMIG
ncbi:fumarylacetoacetate hydrolase family protein [Donghicola sp. C2-DW-16]|uniref:Fumarylacetoacetate hydrolase family protein n=1 Tax=Donghicola mangrovi TaxID=2729614 RepID=A0ABX2PIG2_9RHOB|nr:fumarylacetoacetate hydrolase family protein [Donghicola mangrovi]NVO28547.1 fumarylacetoacetate hydrolase family protein [Donghicola mangrovi]